MFPAFCFCIVEVRTPICERTFSFFFFFFFICFWIRLVTEKADENERKKMESWILEKAKFVFGIVGVF